MLCLAVVWSLLAMVSATNLLLRPRSVQSSAVCLSEFDWMSNSLHQSPCLVAGYLLGQCAGGNWNVPANTNASNHYSQPTTQTANGCSCSWAVYNLMQACAFCQGEHFNSAIFGWDGWMTNCAVPTNFLSGPDPFPVNVSIPDATAIPFFAVHDPTNWANAIFDPIAAQNLSELGEPDLTQASRTESSDSPPAHGANIGAIAGGVAAGVVLLTILGISCCVCYRKRRGIQSHSGLQRGQSLFSTATSNVNSPFGWSRHRPNHWRTQSDDTMPMSQSRLMSQSPASAITESLNPSMSTFRPPLTSQPSSFSGSFSTIPGSGVSMSVQSPDSSHVPTLGHGQNVHFQSMHAHALSTGSTGTSNSQSSRPGMHGRNPSQDSADSAVRPYHIPQRTALPEVYEEETGAPRNASPGSASVTPSGVLMTHPMQKERRNPPAYSPVSSPEERYFASMAPDAFREQADSSNHETASETMIDNMHDPSGRRSDADERREYPPDRKRR